MGAGGAVSPSAHRVAPAECRGPALREGAAWQDSLGMVPGASLGVSDKGRWLWHHERTKLGHECRAGVRGADLEAETQGRSRSWLVDKWMGVGGSFQNQGMSRGQRQPSPPQKPFFLTPGSHSRSGPEPAGPPGGVHPAGVHPPHHPALSAEALEEGPDWSGVALEVHRWACWSGTFVERVWGQHGFLPKVL